MRLAPPRRRGGWAIRWVLPGLVTVSVGCASDRLAPPPGFESPTPGVVLDMAPGERLTVRAAELMGGIEIPAAEESRSYLFVVHDTRSTVGGATGVRIGARRIPTALSPGLTPSAAVGSRRSVGSGPRPRQADTDPITRWYAEGEESFRRSVERELERRGARAARPRSPEVRASVTGSTLSVDQLLDLGSPVRPDGSLAACTSDTRITGRVRAIGAHFAIVEDTAVAGEFGPADFSDLLAEIEAVAWPVNSAYFGKPRDIDGNGRVIALITGEVNRLGAAGFFTSSDLADQADCPSGNSGEVLWLIAPDPTGRFGATPTPVELLRERLPGIVAHELQHLIHLERRVFEGGGDLASADRAWLNEGMSHIAEEVSGFYAAGVPTRQNFEPDLATSEGRIRFSRYHLALLRFTREYLKDTETVPLLVDGPITRADLQKARGFGFYFLRWLADRYAAEGPDGLVGSTTEQDFFRDLTLGGPGVSQSAANVLGALGRIGVDRDWSQLLAEFVGVPALDDLVSDDLELDVALTMPTWNFPSAYEIAGSNGYDLDFPNGYPLEAARVLLRTMPDTGFFSDFDLVPSGAAYFRFVGLFETPLTSIVISGRGGMSLASDPNLRITIIRTV